LDGASAAAFRAGGYDWTGIDREPKSGLDVIQATTPDLSPAVAELTRRGLQYDLVIDDGSHRLPCQLAALEALWPFMAPSGVLLIEDIQSEANADNLIAAAARTGAHVALLDTRPRSRRYDDLMLAVSRESLGWLS
jgi:hypothetical protein